MAELFHDINISHKLQMMLSPKLLEMLNFLSLPMYGLMEKLEKEAEENPTLEIEKPEMLYEYAEYLGIHRKERKELDYSEYDGLKNIAASAKSLRENLLEQMGLCNLSEEETKIAEDLIDHIDQNGYLKGFEKEMTADIEKVLKIIQGFEPDGIGARDIKECLQIQIREYNFEDPEIEDLLSKVVAEHLDELGRKEYKKIADTLGVLEQDIIDVANFIKENLTPYPAAGFSEQVRSVVPSFAIEKKGKGLKVVNLEERYGPKIKISAQYEKMLRDPATDQKTVKFLKERIERTKEIIEHLSKRQETGNKIMGLIAERQADFFKKGADYFKPLLQKELAGLLGLNPSTISRAVAEKYVQTPNGLFPLRYLCPRKISGFSSFEIKSRIKRIVENEDAKKTYSDGEILDILKREGIDISRRTVSTFRKELGIKTSEERKP